MFVSDWLWPGWIPFGHLSLLCGPSGAHTAAWLATAVLRDDPFPDGAHVESHSRRQVMWLDSLEGYERLLVRLRALKTPPGIFWPVENVDE